MSWAAVLVAFCLCQQPVLEPPVMAASTSKATPAPDKLDPYENAILIAIHEFAKHGELEYLRALLEKHPKLINARIDIGWRKPPYGFQYTLLHRAASQPNSLVVKYLLEKGADIEADGGDGRTPLHIAAEYGNKSVVERLVKDGAKVDARTTPTPARVAPSGPAGGPPAIFPAVPALTPLDIANKHKHTEIAEYLDAQLKRPREK